MPKLKTSKTISERVRVTGTGKIRRRSTGQDHFNAKDPGKRVTGKRRDAGIDDKKLRKTIKRSILTQ